MKKVININFQGQVIAIEETAYEMLQQYIESLQDYFAHEEGGDEIVNDIESRIAELFGNRLKHGINCITDEDVESVISSIGHPKDFDTDYEESVKPETPHVAPEDRSEEAPRGDNVERRPLYRNDNDKILGGVCSGLAHYFKIDPVLMRIIFVLFFGVLFWVYIVLWVMLKPKKLETNVTKRLYRNPNDRFLGGVCGGIAAYFRIDSWIPRGLFLVPLLFNLIGIFSFFPLNHFFDDTHFNWNINSSMILVYIVLWIIIPEAKTVKQKLEMMGEEEYIRTIREKVSDNMSGSRSRYETEKPAYRATENMTGKSAGTADVSGPTEVRPYEEGGLSEEMPPQPPVTPKPPLPPVNDPRDFEVNQQTQRPGCLNVLVIFLKIVFFTFVGIFALVLVGLFIGFLVAGTQFMSLKALFIDPGYETNLLIVALSLIVLVPVVSIITWIIRRIMKAKSHPVIGIISFVLWFAGIALTGVLTKNVADKYATESSKETVIALSPINTDRLYVDMLPYGDDYAEFKLGYGWNNEIDELPYTTVNEDSLLFRNIHLYVKKSDDTLFHVRTIAASNGKDLRTAKGDIAAFTYTLEQKDSLLLLPEFLSVPVSQGFRDQSMTVEIAVPVGKTVEISDALEEYKNNEPPSVVRKRIRNYSPTNYQDAPETADGRKGIVITYDSL
ncbi:MAG: PspC domain-containing protein [Porphyromonadaceae bacterium]|nr:PspC domain-containing protein [Porphyromonadaceae bacterium]